MTTNPMALIPAAVMNEGIARKAQLIVLFDKLDERGQLTTLALIAVAAKLHPKVAA
jgi:hypothetical protein